MISSLEQQTTSTSAGAVRTLEDLCRKLDDQSADLEERIHNLQSDLAAIKAKHFRGISKQAAVVATVQAELHALIEANPELFTKPRTRTIHGVKCGLIAGKGKVESLDEENTIKKIKKLLADQADVLIRTKETLNKDALRELPAGDLARIGCTLAGLEESVLIKRTAGDIEKLMNTLVEKLTSEMVESDSKA